MVPANDKFEHPTKRVNELLQTDFTQFKVQGWGWYYLSTVLDDYSRYILAWKPTTTMGSEDVKDTLEIALEKTGLQQVKVKHRPLLLSDNGSCYISNALKDYLQQNQIEHTRGAPYHPITQSLSRAKSMEQDRAPSPSIKHPYAKFQGRAVGLKIFVWAYSGHNCPVSTFYQLDLNGILLLAFALVTNSVEFQKSIMKGCQLALR